MSGPASELRRASWFAPDDFRSFAHRSRVMQMGMDRSHGQRQRPAHPADGVGRLHARNMLLPASFANGIAVAMGMACSTNAIIHLVAISRHVGVIATVRPSGERYPMEDFFYAGGLPAKMNVMRGKLAPDGVVIKPGACAPRMSGTGYGGCLLHCSPEVFVGGPLALVRTGDTITVDVSARCIHLNIGDDELARRKAAWQPPPRRCERGYGWLFGQHILQAHEGCDFDFLDTGFGARVPEPLIFRGPGVSPKTRHRPFLQHVHRHPGLAPAHRQAAPRRRPGLAGAAPALGAPAR